MTRNRDYNYLDLDAAIIFQIYLDKSSFTDSWEHSIWSHIILTITA